MAKIITVTAFHQGAGVSTIAANVAVALAQQGRRVGLIDACVSSPAQYLLFNLTPPELPPTFNDFLLGRCDLPPASHVLPNEALALTTGRLYLVPADPDWNEIRRSQQASCSVDVLGPALQRLIGMLRLDVVVIDSDAGLVDSALAAIALSDNLLVVVQLDQQRYQGASVAIDVATQFEVPRRSLVINSVSPSFDPDAVQRTVEQSYGLAVAGMVPYCEELSALCSAAIFIVRYPDHPVAAIFRQIATSL